MLTEQAQVVAVDGGQVRVATVRQSACSSCRSKAGCGQKMLAEIGKGSRFEVVASNPLQLLLSPGDTVELGIEESSFVQASLLVYLLPLLALILGAGVFQFVGAKEGWVVVAGVLSMAAGFVVVRWWSRQKRMACRFEPQIVARVNSF